MARTLRLSSSLALSLLVLGAAACATSVDDEQRADHPPPDTRCPVFTRTGGCRAAGMQERVTIASGGLLLPAAGFAVGDSGYLAFGVRWGDKTIMSSRSDRDWSFDAARALPWALANGGTGVTTQRGSALYFVAQIDGVLGLNRSPVDDGVLGAPVPVVLDGSNGPPSWPQAVGLADGRTLLAFVVPQSAVLAGVDDGTGTRFRVSELPLGEPDFAGVLAHVGTTTRGSWVLTYQVADGSWSFRSNVVLSRNEGITWSDPSAGLLSDGDVFDAFPLARKDDGADVYYVKKSATEQEYTHIHKEEQVVYRRALHEDGTLGAEQPVTSSTLGSIESPQPRRLRDGRIAMLLSVRHGETDKDLALVVLDGDAPP